ncbi:hypothetical protein ACLKA6_006897 [Drosophila palustris]
MASNARSKAIHQHHGDEDGMEAEAENEDEGCRKEYFVLPMSCCVVLVPRHVLPSCSESFLSHALWRFAAPLLQLPLPLQGVLF